MNWPEVKGQSLCNGETGQRCWEGALPSVPGMKCYTCPVTAVGHAGLVGYGMQKRPYASASVQRLHSVLLKPGFLSCAASAVAGGRRRLKPEVESLYVPKFST